MKLAYIYDFWLSAVYCDFPEATNFLSTIFENPNRFTRAYNFWWLYKFLWIFWTNLLNLIAFWIFHSCCRTLKGHSYLKNKMQKNSIEKCFFYISYNFLVFWCCHLSQHSSFPFHWRREPVTQKGAFSCFFFNYLLRRWPSLKLFAKRT